MKVLFTKCSISFDGELWKLKNKNDLFYEISAKCGSWTLAMSMMPSQKFLSFSKGACELLIDVLLLSFPLPHPSGIYVKDHQVTSVKKRHMKVALFILKIPIVFPYKKFTYLKSIFQTPNCGCLKLPVAHVQHGLSIAIQNLSSSILCKETTWPPLSLPSISLFAYHPHLSSSFPSRCSPWSAISGMADQQEEISG
jgi:hypothetical protein